MKDVPDPAGIRIESRRHRDVTQIDLPVGRTSDWWKADEGRVADRRHLFVFFDERDVVRHNWFSRSQAYEGSSSGNSGGSRQS